MALGTDSGGVPAVMNVTPTGGYNNGNCGGWGFSSLKNVSAAIFS